MQPESRIRGAKGPENVGAVSMLLPAGHQQLLLTAQRQQRIEQQRLCATLDHREATPRRDSPRSGLEAGCGICSVRTHRSRGRPVPSRADVSSRSSPGAAFAARRSDRFSAICTSVTKASRQGASTGCPWLGNNTPNCQSVNAVPRMSRSRMYQLPRGNAPRATMDVDAGTTPAREGRSDCESLQH